MKWNEYYVLYNEISVRELPKAGTLYICLDPQKTLGPKTWSVSIMGDGTLEGDTVRLGLFWSLANARILAMAYYNQSLKPTERDSAA